MQANRSNHAARAVADAPFVENGWSSALSLLRDCLSVRAVRLSAIDISTGRWRQAVSGLPEAAVAAAVRADCGAPQVNPRVARALIAPVLSPWTDDDLAPLEERRTWAIYRDVWEPNGCEQGWSVVLFRNGDTVVLLTAADSRRSARRNEVTDLLAELAEVAATAVERERSLRLREAATVGRTMTAMGTGAVTLDGFARVLDVNSHARDYLDRAGALRVRGSRLHALDANLDGHLQRLLEHVTRAVDPVGSEVAMPGDGGRFMIVPVAPSEHDVLGFGAIATVAINPLRPRAGDADHKAAAYGLSAAERAIMPSFLNGASIDEIAAQRGTTRETIRSQLKSIYAKVGVNSRTELVVAFLGGGNAVSDGK